MKMPGVDDNAVDVEVVGEGWSWLRMMEGRQTGKRGHYYYIQLHRLHYSIISFFFISALTISIASAD